MLKYSALAYTRKEGTAALWRFRHRPELADSTYSVRCRKAALGIDCSFSNGGFADFPGTHTSGQERTMLAILDCRHLRRFQCYSVPVRVRP